MAKEVNDAHQNLFDQTAADMNLAIEGMDTQVDEDYISAASNQLHSLLTQIGNVNHSDAPELLSDVTVPDVTFKQEQVSLTSNVLDTTSILPCNSSSVMSASDNDKGSNAESVTVPVSHSDSLPQSCHQDNSSSKLTTSIQQHCNVVEKKEVQVHLKRLSPATIAGALKQSGSTKTHSHVTRNHRGSDKKLKHDKPQSSVGISQGSNNQRVRTSKSTVKMSPRGLQGSDLSRKNLRTVGKGKQSQGHSNVVKSGRNEINIDDLSRADLKKLLIKSQTTIRSLSKKLLEQDKSENEVFGRLIGKMIGSVKSRWRLEGLKLHIHNLVCETVLQDMEESGS